MSYEPEKDKLIKEICIISADGGKTAIRAALMQYDTSEVKLSLIRYKSGGVSAPVSRLSKAEIRLLFPKISTWVLE